MCTLDKKKVGAWNQTSRGEVLSNTNWWCDNQIVFIWKRFPVFPSWTKLFTFTFVSNRQTMDQPLVTWAIKCNLHAISWRWQTQRQCEHFLVEMTESLDFSRGWLVLLAHNKSVIFGELFFQQLGAPFCFTILDGKTSANVGLCNTVQTTVPPFAFFVPWIVVITSMQTCIAGVYKSEINKSQLGVR